ncbi:hypothetical protein HA72_0954 [Metallosphaera sedula]|uniref:Uncharacterized protein n=2 Tax=Metallosphaera sedula TaxID=43687 RepID=A4YFC3_METS5|nr:MULTISPECIES: hypothetical protein [Metallosphaera]ABP95125.1 hypothetical protein Msed_0954 [Metallosphaera sedula DSM 5348]AIM27111.1 hypothetical protein HA72_0954 [Metallosphaera sedula]AKV74019.1 hypothetical protein MsedA_0969 [Metallosphaera sedula]AKV76258.1 hypothetical protein MsedB_0970 [Metallosphaera sedula]AKV78511.1 hypothetical protein MsedC_0969 [Metallosphaera sedula]
MVPISILLNVVHGFSSLVYFGGVMLFGAVFAPKLAKLSNSTVFELMRDVFPSVLSFAEAVGLLTMVFGAGEFLYYMLEFYRSGGLSEVYRVLFSTPWGASVFSGALIGLVGFLVGVKIASIFERLFRLYRSVDPSKIDEIRVLEMKLRLYSLVGMVLLTTTVLLMVLAVSFLPLPR